MISAAEVVQEDTHKNWMKNPLSITSMCILSHPNANFWRLQRFSVTFFNNLFKSSSIYNQSHTTENLTQCDILWQSS
jgi:hypothetical protein